MNKAGSLLGALAVIAIAIVFVVNFQPGGGTNQFRAEPECAAEVLGRCIKGKHYWATYRMLAGGNTDVEHQKNQEMVLNALIERELLVAEAKRLGLSVSEEELTKELTSGRVHLSRPMRTYVEENARRKAFGAPPMPPHSVANIGERFLDRKTKVFSPQEYKKAIGEILRLSEDEYREFQRAEIVAERMRDLIMARVEISEVEAYDTFAEKETTAQVEYVQFQPNFYVNRGVDRSKAAIETWAARKTADIDKELADRMANLAEGCRIVRQIFVNVPLGAPEDAKAPAKARIEGAKKRIAEGATFEDVAREVSEDMISGPDGGLLGCLTSNEARLHAFAKPVFEVKEPGLIEQVAESPRGLHLLKVDKILTGAEAEAATREAIVRDRYLADESRRLAAEAAKEVQAAVKGGKPLKDALDAHLAKLPKPAAAPQPGDKEGEPKKDEPKGDEPKKDGDEPKDADAPAKDDEPKEKVDPLMPVVETSTQFTVTEEPFPQLEATESAAAVAFGLGKKGDVAEKLLALRGGGLLLMVLEGKTLPSDEDWQKEKAQYVDDLRHDKQLEALAEYLRRLREARTADIKRNEEFFPKAEASAKPVGTAPPPPP